MKTALGWALQFFYKKLLKKTKGVFLAFLCREIQDGTEHRGRP